MIGALLSATLAASSASAKAPPAPAAAIRRPGPAGALLIVESNHTVPLCTSWSLHAPARPPIRAIAKA